MVSTVIDGYKDKVHDNKPRDKRISHSTDIDRGKKAEDRLHKKQQDSNERDEESDHDPPSPSVPSPSVPFSSGTDVLFAIMTWSSIVNSAAGRI
jgi:hypothetical protein